MVFYVNMLFAGVVESRRGVLLREGGSLAGGTNGGDMVSDGQPVQVHRCS